MAGARVEGMQKNETSTPSCVPGTPVRVMLSVKQGRFLSMHEPAPGVTSSQSEVPDPGRQDRKFWFEQRPSIGPPRQVPSVQTPSVQELGEI